MKLPTVKFTTSDSPPTIRRSRLRRLYLDASALVARADGAVAEAELATIATGLTNIGLLDAGDDLTQLFGSAVEGVAGLDLGLVESQWEKEALVSVLLAIANCDGDYDHRERAIVHDVSDRIGLPRHRVDALESIVKGALP